MSTDAPNSEFSGPGFGPPFANSENEADVFSEDADRFFMTEALTEARRAGEAGEVPIGAVIVHRGRIIARGRNRKEERRDATAHAEMEAIRAAGAGWAEFGKKMDRSDGFPSGENPPVLFENGLFRFASWRLENCSLYVTLEPCPMCSGAILQSRIRRVIFGTADPKAGAVESLFRLLDDPRLNHRCEIRGGVLEEECREILRNFFRRQRELGKK